MMRWCPLLLVFALSACTEDTFVCSEDGECHSGSVDGQCELSGYCSFPDESCPSGRRYGDLAGGGLAGTCVDPQGGSSTSGVTTSISTSESSTAQPSTSGATSSATSSESTPSGSDPVTGPVFECGNADQEVGEDCDGADLGGESCSTVGFDAGPLACNPDCSFDVSACTRCGDGTIDDGETCDSDALGDQACQDIGFFGGELVCTNACTLDASGCHNCGNGTIDPGELCDGPPQAECGDLGFAEGKLGCAADCSNFDASGCGPIQCGVDPQDPFSECPNVCDSCDEGTCLIECGANVACPGDDIVCPPGWPCTVVCDGSSSCAGAEITCPDFMPCAVECSGSSACAGVDLVCSLAGACSLSCSADSNVCSGADVVCGLDGCVSTCEGATAPDMSCNGSCDCATCG